MKQGHFEIEVADPLKSMQFYTDVLGFSLVSNQGDTFIWLSLDDLAVMLRPLEPSSSPGQSPFCIVLYSDDLHSDAERLKSKGCAMEFRSDNCWHFSDPDGNRFQLVDPGDDHSG